MEDLATKSADGKDGIERRVQVNDIREELLAILVYLRVLIVDVNMTTLGVIVFYFYYQDKLSQPPPLQDQLR
uniref:Uncharacterized protein n=1 Tax=Cucumis melo TaxID=3656 RepID=A0A9I9ECY6_CUCME